MIPHRTPYIEGEDRWKLIRTKFEGRIITNINSDQFPKKPPIARSTLIHKDISEGVPRILKRQVRNSNSQKTPCNQKWRKIGAMGLLSHVRTEGQTALVQVNVGLRAQSEEEPLLGKARPRLLSLQRQTFQR